MTTMYSFKIKGTTTGDAVIGTVSVTIDFDGTIHYTDSNSKARTILYGPQDSDGLARLFYEIFTGGSGIDAGSAGVQGHRVFGEPRILQ